MAILQVAEIIEILTSGQFDRLVGAIEDEHLECKAAPYQLGEERQKMELAKDVSALANTDGGMIVIGARTEKNPSHLGDEVRSTHPFAENFVDRTQCQHVLFNWIYPVIPGVRIDWHPSARQADVGLVSILVPTETSQGKPFLTGRVVEQTGRVVGSYIGYFERKQATVTPTSVQQLRESLKEGLRFHELSARIQSLEGSIGQHISGALRPVSLPPDVIRERVERACAAVELDQSPTLFLACWPQEAVQIPTLFQGRQAPVVRLLENPPMCRGSGFNLGGSQQISAIVQGELRRVTAPRFRLLELWRDGCLIVIRPGDSWHLCWGMDSNAQTGLKINNLALTETTYLFADLALRVYQFAAQQPIQLNFQLGMENMSWGERPCSLSTAPVPSILVDYERRYAPAGSKVVDVPVQLEGSTAGAVAYNLLAELYAWFGFDQDSIPYVDTTAVPLRVNPGQFPPG